MTVLVTGAQGNVGAHVVSELKELGVTVRQAGRSVPHGSPDHAQLDFWKPETWQAALDGCAGVFLMRPPAITDIGKTLGPFIDQAYEQGVEHIVFLSVAGAQDNTMVPHHKVEVRLKACGEAHTILRPGFFAQNLASSYAQDIREDDRIYVPAGRSPVRWIDARDIAKAAAVVLSAPQAHRGSGYTLEGPQLDSWEHVAQVLSEVTGRPITYVPASVPGYMWHLRRRGMGAEQILVQTVLHALLRRAPATQAPPDLERLIGGPGRTVERYIRDHAQVWCV